MEDEILHIATVVSNPLRWETRNNHAVAAIKNWLKEPNIIVYVGEVAHGARDHCLIEEFINHPRVVHIPLKATTMAWSKENVLNLIISRMPFQAKYIGTFDADILFRKSGWALETIHQLQIYPVVQPWKTAYDLGPNDDHIQTHKSFSGLYRDKKPVVSTGSKFWRFDGGQYDYAHSGYAWAWLRSFLNIVGGLFEYGGMGSADHHMALGLIGKTERSLPGGVTPEYKAAVLDWGSRANLHLNGKLGVVHQTIEHLFHGDKARRGYLTRWEMFIKHEFNPYTDLKRNSYGVLEFAGNKPDLEHDFTLYLESRQEDNNFIG